MLIVTVYRYHTVGSVDLLDTTTRHHILLHAFLYVTNGHQTLARLLLLDAFLVQQQSCYISALFRYRCANHNVS